MTHLCGISESLIFEELTFRARARLVRVFTGVKPQTSLAGRDLSSFSSKRMITDISGKDFKGFLGG